MTVFASVFTETSVFVVDATVTDVEKPVTVVTWTDITVNVASVTVTARYNAQSAAPCLIRNAAPMTAKGPGLLV